MDTTTSSDQEALQHDPSGRACALAGAFSRGETWATEAEACNACLVTIAQEPTREELSAGLDAIIARANARAQARLIRVNEMDRKRRAQMRSDWNQDRSHRALALAVAFGGSASSKEVWS